MSAIEHHPLLQHYYHSITVLLLYLLTYTQALQLLYMHMYMYKHWKYYAHDCPILQASTATSVLNYMDLQYI